MEKNRDCRIGRYEAVTVGNTVEIYDMHDGRRDGRGRQTPMKTMPLPAGKTGREGCLMAIAWLRETGRIDASDFYRHTEAFMSSDSVDHRQLT